MNLQDYRAVAVESTKVVAAPDSSQEIAAQLARLLETTAFSRSPSLGRLLSYLVEQALAGNGDGVKEYQLGVDVFDRGEDFDPRIDNIVRVQARNLRVRLDEYFENPAPADTYRFVLPKGAYVLKVEPIAAPAPIPLRETQSRLGVTLGASALGILLAIWLGVFWMKSRGTGTLSGGKSTLMVAPFANLSADANNDYFASGLTEELTDALSELPGLRVVARTASARWKDQDLNLGALRELGITQVVQGSIRKQENQVRISVRLIDAATGTHLWSHDYDAQVRDAILTEQEIANAIASTLKLKLSPASTQVAKAVNPDAYELYLKGRYEWHRIEAGSAANGIRYLERAIEIDPGFAPAYVALAGCYGTQGVYYAIPPTEGYAKIGMLSRKALQIDDSDAEAHTFLGGVYAWNDWNWTRAELEYRAAAQLAPQSVIAHQYFASFLGALGRQPEAEAEMQEAMRLDPLDSLLQWGEAQLKHWRGENREAEAALQKLELTEPDFGLTAQLLAQVEWSLGKLPEAEAALRKRLAKHPTDPLPLGELGYTLAKLNRVPEAMAVLRQLEEAAGDHAFPTHAIAMVQIGLGNQEKAIDALSKALDRRAVRAPWLKTEPIYASLRGHPRYEELLRRVNLGSR